MLKKILLISFVLVSTYTFSQKNEILISPPSMTATSAIIIETKEKGNYTLIIKSKESNKVLYSKDIYVENRNGFKHNFASYKNGEYIFIVKKNNKEIFKVSKTK